MIEIKVTNKYIDPNIIKLECQVQTIILQLSYSYTRYLKYRLILKALSISYSYLTL